MDGFASPLVVNALCTSRDGTMDVLNHRPFPQLPRQKPLNDSGQLKRWDPWVRATVGQIETTQHLSYSTVGTTGFSVSAGGVPFVTLYRPTPRFLYNQLPLVQSWAELRDERASEILGQIDNQFAFIGAVTGLNVVRHRWTMEWLMMVIQLAIVVEMAYKHVFACHRPVEYSPQVQPIISTPGHGTFPMGHGTQAFATVVALQALLKLVPTDYVSVQLVRQARRISINRIVAGVHFPVDAIGGYVLGQTLGEYFVGLCGLARTCPVRAFGLNLDPGKAMTDRYDFLGERGANEIDWLASDDVVDPLPRSDFLRQMTALASAEWSGYRSER